MSTEEELSEEEIKRYALESQVMKRMLSIGTLIGSRAIGMESFDSDYDICVKIEDYKIIKSYIEDTLEISTKSIEYTVNRIMNTSAIDFRIDGKRINLIEYEERMLPIIDKINNIIISIKDQGYKDLLEDKRARKYLFEGILGFLLPLEMEEVKEELNTKMQEQIVDSIFSGASSLSESEFIENMRNSKEYRDEIILKTAPGKYDN